MLDLLCPVCGCALRREARRYCCEKRHSFDCARSGYVNLLPPSPAGKRHGDDKRMVAARTAFLTRGYYDHLKTAVAAMAASVCAPGARILDAGCGEGTYTRAIYDALLREGTAPELVGVDISTDALKAAARRVPEGCFCAASTAKLPLAEESLDLIVNIFSPFMVEEFHRVLAPSGYLLRVVPLERHLFELKAAVYATPYENPPVQLDAPGFVLRRTERVEKTLLLADNAAVRDLFLMTPYYYKTGVADQKKLETLSSLRVTTAFALALYQKA